MADYKLEMLLNEPQRSRKQHVLDIISDAVADMFYYDRKEDESMRVGEIEEMISSGEITIDEMVEAFRKEIGSAT